MSGSGSSIDATDVQTKIDDDLQQQATDAGIDVEQVVADQIEENGEYGVKTIVRFTESALNRQIEAASAEVVSGILCGSRDRYGKNWPRRYALVRSNGDHIEASSWKGSLPTSDGGEREIPSAAAVEMRLEYDEEYDSYEAKQLDSVEQLPKAELVDRLSKVARHPSAIGRDDEYEMVVVKGEVAYVNPQTIFEDGDPKGDGPIMLEDENGQPKPHFELVLSEEADTRLRAHVERQRYSDPLMGIEDFGKLCRDANEKFSTPDDQTQFVGDAMRGREVAVVGNVNSVDQSRSNGEVTKYIDVGVAGIVELDTDDDMAAQESPAAESEPEPEPEPEQEQESDDSDDDSLEDFEEYDADDDDDDEDEPTAANIDDVAADVQQYADLVGMDQSEITAEVIEENTEIDAPSSVLEAAIERIGEDAPEDDADAEDSTDDEPDDPIESLRNDETGQLECPAEDCFANASGEAGLYGHIGGTHITGDKNPEEWVLDQIEG
jgi:hypothetical protein